MEQVSCLSRPKKWALIHQELTANQVMTTLSWLGEPGTDIGISKRKWLGVCLRLTALARGVQFKQLGIHVGVGSGFLNMLRQTGYGAVTEERLHGLLELLELNGLWLVAMMEFYEQRVLFKKLEMV